MRSGSPEASHALKRAPKSQRWYACRSGDSLWVGLGNPISSTAVFVVPIEKDPVEGEKPGKQEADGKLLGWREVGELCICGIGLAATIEE